MSFGVLGLFLQINGQFVLICAKMVKDLFFCHPENAYASIFEHKRGVPANGKTENFGCFMAFSRSLNFPNGEFKTKKPVKSTGVFFITFAHPYSRLVLRSLGKGGRELLHGRRKPTSSQATARSDFTSKAKRRF